MRLIILAFICLQVSAQIEVNKSTVFTLPPRFNSGFIMGNELVNNVTNNSIPYINVKDYGAKGDGIRKYDGSTTNGVNRMTSVTTIFTQADVGKSISIAGAMSGGNDLACFITGIVSSNTVSLSATPTATAANCIFWYGTDDTESIQAAINAWHADKRKRIFVPCGIYIIAGPIQRDIDGLDMNGQIYIPYTPFGADRATITIEGEMPALGFYMHREISGGIIPYSDKGVIFKSNYTNVETNNTSVISTMGEHFSGPIWYNFTVLKIMNIQIIVDAKIGGAGPVLGGINGAYMDALIVENCGVTVNRGLGATQEPTRNLSGIHIGPVSDDQPNIIRNTNVSGFKYGITTQEHVLLDYVSILGCQNGLRVRESGFGTYATSIQIYWCKNYIICEETTYNAIFNAGMIEVEHMTSEFGNWWFNHQYDVIDVNNKLSGSVVYNASRKPITKNGGVNFFIYLPGQNIPIWSTATRPNKNVPVIGFNVETGNVDVYDTLNKVYKTIIFN